MKDDEIRKGYIRIRIPQGNMMALSALNIAHDLKLNLNRNLVKLSHLEVGLDLRKHVHNLKIKPILSFLGTIALLHIPHA